MEITRRNVDGVTILGFAGRFAVGSTDTGSASIRSFISRLVSEGRVDVLLHLSAVTDIDAHGIGELAWSLTTMRRHGGHAALIAPSRYVRRMLAVTKLDTMFAVHESEPEAIVSIRRLERARTADHRSAGMASGARASACG
jgi:anti-anti-sigma factor